MAEKLSKSGFAKRVGAKQTNPMWSWVAINEEEKVAYFFGWAAAYDGKTRLHPMIIEADDAPWFGRRQMEEAGSNGYPEYLRTIERVKAGDLEPRLVLSKHKGQPSIPMKFDYSPAFYMIGQLHELEGSLYFKVEGRTEL